MGELGEPPHRGQEEGLHRLEQDTQCYGRPGSPKRGTGAGTAQAVTIAIAPVFHAARSAAEILKPLPRPAAYRYRLP
jgi:hypothetical protein